MLLACRPCFLIMENHGAACCPEGSLQPSQDLLYQDPALMYQLGVGSSSAKLMQAAAAGKAARWPPEVTPGMADLLGNPNPNPSLMRSAMAANMVQVMDLEGKIYYYNPAEG